MNILILGCGSIGSRHAKNLKDLGHNIVVCDKDEMRIKHFGKQNKCNYYYDYLDAIKNENLDGAVIATPSNFHTKPAVDLATCGINIFMEKPLSTSLNDIGRLDEIIKKNKLVFMMGQSYRFHEGLLCLKKLIDQKIVGDIYNVEMLGGWYLPDWHFKEDYRKMYAARSELGGGVLLTSLSHAIDTTRWLFGEVIDFNGWKSKVSNLDIDVDDFVTCTIITEQRVIVNIIDDFLCRLPRNEIRLYGSDGFIVTEFNKNKIHYWHVNNKRFFPNDQNIDPNYNYTKVLEDGIRYDPKMDTECFKFDINKRYYDEMIFFIDKVENNAIEFSPNLSDGMRVLEILTSDKIKMI